MGVLGNKRLLDTPFSVTVVDEEDINKRGATTLGQVFINDPSVFAAEPSATTNWWGTQIRGIGVLNHYVDGVPMLMEWGGEFPLEAVESVQALKGLGGFMYGFGGPARADYYYYDVPVPGPNERPPTPRTRTDPARRRRSGPQPDRRVGYLRPNRNRVRVGTGTGSVRSVGYGTRPTEPG